jgi:predicted DNA-binding transcriptional regulator AlpA
MHVSGPFMTLKQAAEYCGYAPATFRRKLREYDLPRHGPEQNRFARSVLDNWMQNPEVFRKVQPNRKRKPLTVTV